jgi:HEAT repeat protein
LWDPGVLEPLGVRDIEWEGDRPDGSKPAKVPDIVRSNVGVPAISNCEKWIRQVSDGAQPASVRIEAVENIGRECRDHQIFQRLGWIVDTEAADLAVRRAIVRILAEWGSPFVPYAIVRALSLAGVRPAAVETLDKMGPVTGEKEPRLVAQLASLRTGVADPIRMSGLPGVFGRDYRVLKYLHELVQTGNRWERALAASELLGLGEMEAALGATRDPEPRVRRSVAWAIGWYRVQRGADVLPRLLEDPDDAVANEARRSLMLLSGSGQASVGHERSTVFRWRPLLKELSEFRLSDPKAAAGLPEQKVKTQWLGEPGATELEITALERRLGRNLPPSYRSFLAESNGFERWSALLQRLYSAGEVDWFRVRNAFWADAYRDTYPNLGSRLQLSDVGDSAVVLLNPNVIAPDGEWQTYFFANWIPGARTYDSFREFMEEELNSRCEWRNR